MTSRRQKQSIYERLTQQAEEFDAAALGEAEADRLLGQLEAAYARAMANTYRLWPRERQYAFDRGSSLVACILVRRCLAMLVEAAEGLTRDEAVFVAKVHRRQLRMHQIELVKLRVAFYGCTATGSA